MCSFKEKKKKVYLADPILNVGHRTLTDDKSYLSDSINFVSVILSKTETSCLHAITCLLKQSWHNVWRFQSDTLCSTTYFSL